ncbi:MAG: energy transducer TonB [Bacteroidales bacterium]|nr:energy transducer TonB [Bacteroidales bacterium]
MYRKKSDQASLENKKGIFFQLGLLIAISMVLISFEWTRGSITLNEYNMEGSDFVDDILIPPTFNPPPKPPKPPKPKVVEELKLVEDTYDLKNELIMEDFDIKEQEEIPFIDYDDDPDDIEEPIFFIVQNMPSFHGKGQDGFREWISQQVEYPEVAAENGISGTVYVSFVVEPDGRVTNVELVRGVDSALDAEAIRVIQLSPKWEPGMQRDVAVRVAFVFPIKFKLQH